MQRSFFRSLRITIVSFFACLLCLQLGFAQVMSSTNYQLQSDSINSGGGLSTSTNYIQESTFGESGTGTATSTNYELRAGYQQLQAIYLSLTAPGDVTLAPSIGGITGGTSNGSTTVTVTTDNPAGYSLYIRALNNPAMQNGVQTIADHATSTTYTFTVPAASARFGYSVYGADADATFRHNGATCQGSGPTNSVEQCWRGLTTASFLIAGDTDANHPLGIPTTLYFRVGVAADAGVTAGLYTATTTLTALPL